MKWGFIPVGDMPNKHKHKHKKDTRRPAVIAVSGAPLTCKLIELLDDLGHERVHSLVQSVLGHHGHPTDVGRVVRETVVHRL